MLGRSINKKIQKELEDRKNALGRNKIDATSGEKSTYSFEDLSVRATYVRLVSPVYGTQIKGRLLQQEEFSYEQGEEGQSPTAVKAKTINNFDREHWRSQNRGVTPPPGITSITTGYMGEGATLNTTKEATIEISCFSLLQYEQLVEEFVMMGRILYLEFGWSNPKLDSKRITADTRNFLTTKLDADNNPTIELDLEAVEKYPQELILNTSGNTDLFVGLVKNYEAKANENGGFDFTITMVSTGAAMYNSTFGQDNSEMVTLATDNASSDKDSVPSESNAEPFEKPSADVRDEMVLMAKLRAIIQEDFNLIDAFQYDIQKNTGAPGSENFAENLKLSNSLTQYCIYNSSKTPKQIFEFLNGVFEVRDFEQIETDNDKYIIARHKSNDLIISMTRVEPPQAQEEIINKTEISTDDISRKQGKIDFATDYSVGTGMYINYFVSMRYLEDNVFNRIFGVVDDKGVVRGGIRSCYFKESEETIKLVNNKMMMHQVIIPKNLNDVLINTEAVESILLKNGAGKYPSSFEKTTKVMKGERDDWLGSSYRFFAGTYKRDKYSFTQADYGAYTDSLQKIIANALPFFNNEEDAHRDSEDPAVLIPNTSVADFRHMYVNVDIVQNAFLGNANEPFYERNTFPSRKSVNVETSPQGYVTETLKLDPMDPVFYPNATVATLKEGMNNLLNTIEDNFHGLPMFELGGNVHLPGFIGVLDMRYTKEDIAYTFDSFSRTSIVKSVDLASQVPNLVQLAMYFGTTQTRMDRVLGNRATHIPIDLVQNINDRYKKKKQSEYSQGKYRGLNFGKSEYLEKAEGDDEFVKHASGSIPPSVSYTRDVVSIFSSGISTKLIYEKPTNTKSSAFLNETKTKDLTIRDNIPGINDVLIQGSDNINKLLTSISGEQDSKYNTIINKGKLKVKTTLSGEQELGFMLTNGDISESYRKPTLVVSSHPDFNHYIDTILYNSDKQSFDKLQGKISFFTLTIVIDGIAGIYPGDAFLISHLPTYLKNKFYFIVSNVEQSLTSEGWSTTITAIQKARRKTIADALPIEDDMAIAYIPQGGDTPVDPDASDVYDPSLMPGRQGGNPDPLTGPLPAEMNSTNQRLLRDTDEDQDPADAQAGLSADQLNNVPRSTSGPMPSREADPPGPPAPPDADYDADEEAENRSRQQGIINEEGFANNPNLKLGTSFPPLNYTKWTPKVLPDVKPFIPYEISQNGTADILISQTGDGQISLQLPPDGPQAEIKVYPGGDSSDPSAALTFNLGIADILSEDEFSDIIDTYVDLGGNQKDVEAKLVEEYEKLSLSDKDEVTNSEEAGRKFGDWDKKRGDEKVVVYIRKTKSDVIMNLMKQTSANPDLQDPDNNTASGNVYIDDILHAIITQPERTNVIGAEIVLPGETNETDVEEVKQEEPLVEQGEDDSENQEADTEEQSSGDQQKEEVVVSDLPEQTKEPEPPVVAKTSIVTPGIVQPVKGDKQMASLRLADNIGVRR